MSVYSAQELDTLQTLRHLKDWHDDDLLTVEQASNLREETTSNLHTTNLFLRIVLFLFTSILLGTATALFFALFFDHEDSQHLYLPLLLFAVFSYIAAECILKEYRLYHFGIEEACTVASIIYLFAALQVHHGPFTQGADPAELLILTTCAGLALWTWHRFGYWYTFAIAMLFTAVMPLCITRSPAAQHALVAVLYAAGLVAVTLALRGNGHDDHTRAQYTTAEAFLWTGFYISLNLIPISYLPSGFGSYAPHFPPVFYWFTYVSIWLIPAAVLALSIRHKDRTLLILGAALLILTFVSNKPYLRVPRHPWDPMLLGALLIAVAYALQRWLAKAPDGVRHGFSAGRLTGQQNAWLATGPAALSLLLAHAPIAHPDGPAAPHGEGGQSGGAGAGGDF